MFSARDILNIHLSTNVYCAALLRDIIKYTAADNVATPATPAVTVTTTVSASLSSGSGAATVGCVLVVVDDV